MNDDERAFLAHLLTEDEHEALRLTGELASQFGRIVGHDATRHADLTEAVALIHSLQHMVMRQAAGRAFPELYRLLGEVLPETVTLTQPIAGFRAAT